MKNETCEKNMDKFLALDKYERIPLGVTLHFLCCKKCRTQARYLTIAERYTSEPIRETPVKNMLENIPIKPVSMAKWIISGIIMILMMVVSGILLNKTESQAFAIILNINFGLIITAYCAIFVGTNMDFFIKKIGKNGKNNGQNLKLWPDNLLA